MPGSDKDKPGILGKGLDNFKNKLVIDTSNKFADATSAFALSAASFYASPLSYLALDAASSLAAKAINCLARSEAKRKAENDSPEEVDCGIKEDPDKFQHIYYKDEIVNKRPRIVDNYVLREEREQELDKLFGIPKPIPNFVKREELEELSENFKKNCSTQVVTSRVSIVGLGGIGKTQLAVKFVERNKGEYKDNFWIDAERYCITDSFKQLAKKMEVSPLIKGGEEKSAKRLANDVYAKLNNQKTLIIFDNVDDYDSVKDFLPYSDYDKINVLITSRYNKWENTGVHPVQLGVFTPKESKEFIKKELKIDDDEEAEKLHNKLQGLPLALQQAIAYIQQQWNVDSKFGIKDYLKEYDKEAEKLLDYDLHEKNNDPYVKTVMTAWKVTLDKIEKDTTCGKEAIRILNVMAYLVPDNISNAILSKLSNIDTSKAASAINLLKNYSMINQGSKSDLSNIHRLVQEVIRIGLKSKQKEETVLSDAFDVLNKKYNTRSSNQLSINDKDYKTISAVLVCIHASQHNSLHERILELFKSLVAEEKEQSLIVMDTEEIVKNSNFFIKYAVQGNNVELVSLILSSMENEWSSRDVQDLLIDCVNDDYAQKSEVTKFLISRIENINRIDVISKSNCMKVVKALAELEKFNRELKFQYLVQAIEESNFDVVNFVLESEPSLVKEKLKEDCYVIDENNEEVYFAKKGDFISKLAYKVETYSEDYLRKVKQNTPNQEVSKFLEKECKNVKKIFQLVRQVEEAEKKTRNVLPLSNENNSIRYPGSDIKDEMESDTESLLSVGSEDSNLEDFEVINYTIKESPRSTVHSLSVIHSGQMYSQRY